MNRFSQVRDRGKHGTPYPRIAERTVEQNVNTNIIMMKKKAKMRKLSRALCLIAISCLILRHVQELRTNTLISDADFMIPYNDVTERTKPQPTVSPMPEGSKAASSIIHNVKPHEMRLPVPIIVMGLPKAGTTSIGSYFQCGFGQEYQHRVSHYDCHKDPHPIERQKDGARLSCGVRMSNNNVDKRPVFHNIDHFDVYSEIDHLYPNNIFFPQLRSIEQIYDAYPNATWILNLRNTTEWAKSVTRSGLRRKLANSKDLHPKFWKLKNTKNGTVEDWELHNFFDRQADFIRKKAKKYPSIHFVEVIIDRSDAGEVLENAFGISRNCWGNRNTNNKTE